MDRISSLWADPVVIGSLSRLEQLEAERRFCRHTASHLWDVARIAYILHLESGGRPEDKELIYAAGLLHDLGRIANYESGRDHDLAGAELAKKILPLHGFCSREVLVISQAIAGHGSGGDGSPLADLLHRADLMSRDCQRCRVAKECHRQPLPYMGTF